MKLLKKIAVLCMALTLCVGFASFTACGGAKNDNPTSEATQNAGYLFKVVDKDGKPASSQYSVQLCVGVEMCYMPVALDANGCATYNPAGFPGEGVYDIHVLGPKDGFPNQQIEFSGETKTPATYSSEYIVLTLK